ncbi:MAG: hypothetical protein ABEH81_04000 [Halopenitus sp.]
MNALLYALTVPDNSQQNTGTNTGINISAQGAISGGQSSVTSVSTNPDDETVQGQYAHKYAQMMATELLELVTSPDINEVPYFNPSESAQIDGYYAPESVDVSPVEPQVPSIQEFRTQLKHVGTRESHRRVAETSPDTVTTPFGSAAQGLLALPTTAEKVRWYNPTDGTVQDATVVRTEPGEHVDVDLYDVTAAPGSKPRLTYKAPYEEWKSDVRVWDEHARRKRTVSGYEGVAVDDADAVVGEAKVGREQITEPAWGRVFRTDHEWRGEPLVETGRLRLGVDEETGALKAWSWDNVDERYEFTALGDSVWRADDVDVRRLGLERVDVQVEFRDVYDTDSSTYSLVAQLRRGRGGALWKVPPNESTPAPTGVTDRVAPIAVDDDTDAGEVAGVIERQEVSP